MSEYKGIHIFEEPVLMDLYDFLFEHLGCACMYERLNLDANESNVLMYAYSEKPIYNYNLRQYFNSKNYKSVRITQGIDESEVNAID